MKTHFKRLSKREVANCLLVLAAASTILAGPLLANNGNNIINNAYAWSSSKAVVQSSPDFDGDGKADLAIGVPNEGVGDVTSAGAVNVLYGTSSRLSSSGDQLWRQSTSGIEGTAEPFDGFGSSVAGGDFDGDGQSDLAIGVPREDIGSINAAGAVNVLYGSSSSGLTSSGDQFWSQNSDGVLDSAESETKPDEDISDAFGTAVVAADFNGDGFSDLAIGVPGEELDSGSPMTGIDKIDTGAVNVLYGSSSGLTSEGNQFWNQDSPGIENTAGANDRFGSALAAGDFDGDGQSDLAIGAPDENIGDKVDVGAVNIIYGSSASGLTSSGDQFWTRDSSGVEGTAESGDRFGVSLGTGDYNGDSNTDLAIGVPVDNVGTDEHAGSVNVLYGSDSSGLTSSNDQLWSQDSSGIEGTTEQGDSFGASLSQEEAAVQ